MYSARGVPHVYISFSTYCNRVLGLAIWVIVALHNLFLWGLPNTFRYKSLWHRYAFTGYIIRSQTICSCGFTLSCSGLACPSDPVYLWCQHAVSLDAAFYDVVSFTRFGACLCGVMCL